MELTLHIFPENDWDGTYPAMISVEMSEEMLKDMWRTGIILQIMIPGETHTTGADNGIAALQICNYHTDYDDEETWNAFLTS